MRWKKFSCTTATGTYKEEEVMTAMNRGEYKVMNIWEIEISLDTLPVTTKYTKWQINKESKADVLALDDNDNLWAEHIVHLAATQSMVNHIYRYKLTSPLEIPIEKFYFAAKQDSGGGVVYKVKIGYTLKDMSRGKARDRYQKILMDW